ASVLCWDSASSGIFADELSRCYKKENHGELPPAGISQYGDFAQQQHQLLRNSSQFPVQLPAQIPVPLRPGISRNNSQNKMGSQQMLPGFFESAINPLRHVPEGIESIGAFLLAACQVLISNLTGNHNIVIGRSFSGREAKEYADIIGTVAITAPVTCKIGTDTRFSDLV